MIVSMLLEFLEREAGDRSAKMIAEAKQFGPVIGGFLGIIPQCGFSAIASEFYAARVISLGALISVYLSTSDEMLPILVSERVSFSVIAKILLIKFVIGTLAGFLIDFLRRSKARGEAGFRSGYCELCHGDEKEPFFKEVCIHTFQIMLFALFFERYCTRKALVRALTAAETVNVRENTEVANPNSSQIGYKNNPEV